MRYIRLLTAVFAVLVSAVAVSVEIAEIVYAHASPAAEFPEANAEAADGEEHPQPDVRDNQLTTRKATHAILVVELRPLIMDGRLFRPPLQSRLQA